MWRTPQVIQGEGPFERLSGLDELAPENAGQNTGGQRRRREPSVDVDEEGVARRFGDLAASVEKHRLVEATGGSGGEGIVVHASPRRLVAKEGIARVEPLLRQTDAENSTWPAPARRRG